MVYSNYETPNVCPEIIGGGLIESSRQVTKELWNPACHKYVWMHWLSNLSKRILHMIMAKSELLTHDEFHQYNQWLYIELIYISGCNVYMSWILFLFGICLNGIAPIEGNMVKEKMLIFVTTSTWRTILFIDRPILGHCRSKIQNDQNHCPARWQTHRFCYSTECFQLPEFKTYFDLNTSSKYSL